MTHLDLDDLAALVVHPDEPLGDVRGHLDTCDLCAQALADLSDVRRLVGEGPLVPAPAAVRAQVLAQAHGEPATPEDVVRTLPRSVPAPVPRRGRRLPVWAAGLAAGIALVAGLGLGRATVGDPAQPPQDAGAVVAATELTALGSDADRGTAEVVRSRNMVTLKVSARELGNAGGFHEVWLINVDGTRMVALGVLAEWDIGEFQVPRGLLDEGYRIVDISVEPDDGDPTHSGVSLARGELA